MHVWVPDDPSAAAPKCTFGILIRVSAPADGRAGMKRALMKVRASRRRGGINVSAHTHAGAAPRPDEPHICLQAPGYRLHPRVSRRRWKRHHLLALVEVYLWPLRTNLFKIPQQRREELSGLSRVSLIFPASPIWIVVCPPTPLLCNLCLLLNIQIFGAITLFSKHSGDLGRMIKAEMIAKLCFCSACFLDVADTLITAGLAFNGLTGLETGAPPERSTFTCASLLLTLSFWGLRRGAAPCNARAL